MMVLVLVSIGRFGREVIGCQDVKIVMIGRGQDFTSMCSVYYILAEKRASH